MNKIQAYLQTTPFHDYRLSLVSADASFRKYYRLIKEKKSYIFMDASLEKESLKPFLDVTQRLHNVPIKVPLIYAQDLALGFLIIEDFGDTPLLDILTQTNFQDYYAQAITLIVQMQQTETEGLPLYDKSFLLFEMHLMQEWYLQKHLGLSLSQEESNMLQRSLEHIVKIVLLQAQNIFVHRDFHSRNIMLTQEGELGIIDYQDAMSGALTYDLVSLLKDCYIRFSRKHIEALALLFRDKTVPQMEDTIFLKYFDFMGLQRHIKVLGVFSRLSIRDKKDGYLHDIPLVLEYVIETASHYEETQALADFLQGLKT